MPRAMTSFPSVLALAAVSLLFPSRAHAQLVVAQYDGAAGRCWLYDLSAARWTVLFSFNGGTTAPYGLTVDEFNDRVLFVARSTTIGPGGQTVAVSQIWSWSYAGTAINRNGPSAPQLVRTFTGIPLDAIAITPASSLLFGVETLQFASGSPDTLFQLDLTTGQVSIDATIGRPVHHMKGLDIDPRGSGSFVTLNLGGTGTPAPVGVYRIDPGGNTLVSLNAPVPTFTGGQSATFPPQQYTRDIAFGLVDGHARIYFISPFAGQIGAVDLDTGLTLPPIPTPWTQGNLTAWVGASWSEELRERLCLRADFNISGMVSVQDVFDFLTAYVGAIAEADFNGNGAVTLQDIFDFLNAFFAAC